MAKRDTSEQARRFGPLTGLVIAAVLAFIVLPSTLTLPNPSPTSQEEIAPVPPTDEKQTQTVSNFTSLSSSSSGNGLGTGGQGPGEGVGPLPELPSGVGNIPPSTYKCVNGRQTEDPLSPTCVPYYIGDNGGSTYQGVTEKEVRIVMYYDPNPTLNTSQGTSTPPYNTIIDLDAAPKAREHPDIFTNRAWQKFFGQRYAAYNRKVHIFVQFGSEDSSGRSTAGTQAQDAALAYAKVKPFAIVNYSAFGNGNFYNNYMAEHGVLIFGSVAGRSASFYKQYPGQQWGYPPPLEYSAAQYANFVCTSLKGRNTSDVGAGSIGIANGTPRKYGFLYTTDRAFEGLTQGALLARDLIKKQCGIEGMSQTYAENGYSVSSTTPTYAVNIALAFRQAGVTTVLWPAGYEQKISGAMKNASYFPEIVVGDDDQQASTYGTSFQDQAVWAHAWIVTSQTYDPPPNERICVTEYRTVDQNAANSDVQNFACHVYNDLRQLYTGIQVAGPTLTPQTVDRGFHAIPVTISTNPQLPTCYYLVGDYTCVKDSVIQHWDPAGQTPSSRNPGCWRMVGNGKRYLPGKFPGTDLPVMKDARQICNNFSQSAKLKI